MTGYILAPHLWLFAWNNHGLSSEDFSSFDPKNGFNTFQKKKSDKSSIPVFCHYFSGFCRIYRRLQNISSSWTVYHLHRGTLKHVLNSLKALIKKITPLKQFRNIDYPRIFRSLRRKLPRLLIKGYPLALNFWIFSRGTLGDVAKSQRTHPKKHNVHIQKNIATPPHLKTSIHP